MSRIYNSTGHKIVVPNITDSDGVYVFDDRGKRYLDLEAGVWCLPLGHKNPRVNQTIKDQIGAISHTGFCYSHPIVEEAAQTVLAITGLENGKCVFLCSGSEAIEYARQVARHVTEKQTSMTMHDSYLGSYSSVKDREKDWYLFDWSECQNCPDQTACKTDCPKLKDIPGDISEFIFEPGSSSGLVRFPPVSVIKNIVGIVRKNGGKIIVNEVTTGIGRTGKWFGYHHYPIEPDMIAIGKGIGNGYPVSVVVLNNETISELEAAPFKYMQSHQNDPLGAAVANEVVKTLDDEDLIAKAEALAPVFLKKLQTLVDGKNVTNVRGRGFMFAIDFRGPEIADTIYNGLLECGYLVCNRGTLFRIDPPLTIEENQFFGFVKKFEELLALYDAR